MEEKVLSFYGKIGYYDILMGILAILEIYIDIRNSSSPHPQQKQKQKQKQKFNFFFYNMFTSSQFIIY